MFRTQIIAATIFEKETPSFPTTLSASMLRGGGHKCHLEGSGRERRRWRRTRNKGESICVSGDEGHVDSDTQAWVQLAT